MDNIISQKSDSVTENLVEGNQISDSPEESDALGFINEFLGELSTEELTHAKSCIDALLADKKTDPESGDKDSSGSILSEKMFDEAEHDNSMGAKF